jgi:nitroreductase
VLEAARWAPSAANTQPWRFVAARRGSDAFATVHAALMPGNQAWAGAASVLLVAAAETRGPDGEQRRWAEYDTGQAVAHLSVQAQHQGLVVHQMGGFDPERLATELRLPAGVRPLVVVALGRHDPAAQLPEPYAAREHAPRERLPLDALLLDVPSGADSRSSRAA